MKEIFKKAFGKRWREEYQIYLSFKQKAVADFTRQFDDMYLNEIGYKKTP